jgi:hypothetical protein
MLRRLWTDDAGFVVSAELVLVATILVIGMLVGLVSVRDQVIQELADFAAAITQMNQSYSFSGITGHTSSNAGSVFNDEADFCQGPFGDDLPNLPAMCISVGGLVTGEG